MNPTPVIVPGQDVTFMAVGALAAMQSMDLVDADPAAKRVIHGLSLSDNRTPDSPLSIPRQIASR